MMSSVSAAASTMGGGAFDTGKINQLFDKIGKFLRFCLY